MGAYVQQDDVLQPTYTPKELFEFAAKIRTNLPNDVIEERVESVIQRLGISECKNQYVGGWLMRGISGGERKRTSIGYELITSPSLMLLDEPTSGLDSSTSLRILQLLKKEAVRGMSILATIHQPSSPLFFLFDRVILLSEGYCVFNGKPSEVKDYFASYGLKMGRYSNPADKLSIIASEPRYALNNNKVTIVDLAQDSDEKQAQNHSLDTTEKEQLYQKVSNRFSIVAQQREVSFCKQFYLLEKRFLQMAVRAPISVIALIFMGFF
jgi:ABC-type multidrug transport system ATPase subunit